VREQYASTLYVRMARALTVFGAGGARPSMSKKLVPSASPASYIFEQYFHFPLTQ